MQLFASHLENRGAIAAIHAEKHKDYLCFECGGKVRRRGGMHRQVHFYHLEARKCHLNAKSMTHIQIQLRLQHLFSPEDCDLECRFPSIARIADVVWKSQKLIFEIQCSPITQKEVEERNSDYHSLGYQVIWILHERRFNQWRLTAAENYLQNHPHYFTDINSEGQGIIYDQYSHYSSSLRKGFLSPLPISVDKPSKLKKNSHLSLNSQLISKRIQSWPIYFTGDLIFHALNHENFFQSEYGFEILKAEQSFKETIQKKSVSYYFKKALLYIRNCYFHIFNIILESMCK